MDNFKDILKKHLLKSFNVGQKVSAKDFNDHVYKQKLKNISNDRKKFVLPSKIYEKEEKEVKPKNSLIKLKRDKEKNTLCEISPRLKDKLVKSLEDLSNNIFNELGDNNLDKETTIIIMNIISQSIFASKNITSSDMKKFNKKYNVNPDLDDDNDTGLSTVD